MHSPYKTEALTESEWATWTKLSITEGLSWSMTSIMGLSSSWRERHFWNQFIFKSASHCETELTGSTWRSLITPTIACLCCCYFIVLSLTSAWPRAVKRMRISRNTPTASFLVLIWHEHSSSRARPSTACSTEQWGLRSGSLGLAWWRLKRKLELKEKQKEMGE